MSTENYRSVKCPHCHEEFYAKFWTVVRGDVDLDLKDLIMRGDFNTLICPNCSNTFFYEDNFIYLDIRARLFVFVLPSYEEGKTQIIEKLNEDYLSIKEYLADKIDFQPLYLFGVDELKKILEKDTDIEEETDVIISICKEKNINTLPIARDIAREKNIPFVLPFEKSKHKHDVIDTITRILAENPTLKRLETLISVLEESDDEIIELIDEDNTIK